jgi:hypothetical protein
MDTRTILNRVGEAVVVVLLGGCLGWALAVVL